MKTKHCAQLKQAALQIPWAGSYSSGNISCQAVYVASTTHTVKNTARKYTLVNLVESKYCELTFSIFLFHLKERDLLYLFLILLGSFQYICTGIA
jgi:hypothetical protein